MIEVSPAPDRAVRTEPIDGWRTWTLAGTRDGSQVLLLPIAGTGKPWPPREAALAVCGKRRRHRVPGLDCTCGIHATLATDPLRRTRDPTVLGTVALWGRVLEHELGYRAERAYPQRLALICPLCFWQWGAHHRSSPEVVVRLRGGRMVPLCGPHLELCRRFGYPMRHRFRADEIEHTILGTYAVDVLRHLLPAGQSSGG